MTHTLAHLQEVAGAPEYEVVQQGEYEPLDLVLCRRKVDTNGPTCQFLCATVLGLEISEVQE